MRVTVFTSNQPRHVALLERLAERVERVWAVQECNTVFPGRMADFFRKSPVMQDYFERVMAAEAKVFGRPRFAPRGVRSLPIRMGDLNGLELSALGKALRADAFVVFGASFIKGPLCDLLVERGAVNIHMGVSPYYRGSSTNFWALYDGRADHVGATIHLLSKGLDSGPMLFHAFPPTEAFDPFELGMRAVESAQGALVERLIRGDLAELEPVPQDRRLELRYTRNADFTDEAAAEYLGRLPAPEQVRAALVGRDMGRFLRPFVG